MFVKWVTRLKAREEEEERRAAVGCLRLSRVSKFREVVGNAILRYSDGDDEEEMFYNVTNVNIYFYVLNVHKLHGYVCILFKICKERMKSNKIKTSPCFVKSDIPFWIENEHTSAHDRSISANYFHISSVITQNGAVKRPKFFIFFSKNCWRSLPPLSAAYGRFHKETYAEKERSSAVPVRGCWDSEQSRCLLGDSRELMIVIIHTKERSSIIITLGCKNSTGTLRWKKNHKTFAWVLRHCYYIKVNEIYGHDV